MTPLHAPWTLSGPELLAALASRADGLTAGEAGSRLRDHGPNELRDRTRTTRLRVLARQLKSPLLLLLVFASAVSIATGDWIDAAIVLAIVLASAGVGGAREWRAERAAELLQVRVRARADVRRGGTQVSVPAAEVVPGDVLLLRAGHLIPADAVVIEADDLHVNEAVLTGESFPARKVAGALPETTPLARRRCCVHQGTNVRSGTATCVVVATGRHTAFGAIAERLELRPPETEFDRGLRRFGALLTTSMFVMVLVVFTAHVLRDRPPIETLLFAIALAVGLSPELLPAILSVNLARGAEAMAARGVLVRRLAAIENLGSMDILCTDKTGTLTEGVVDVGEACDPRGAPSGAALEAAAVNALLSSGLPSPLDEALKKAHAPAGVLPEKRGEIPFDFVRKRVSVVVATPGGARLVTKGAVHRVLAICRELDDGTPIDDAVRAAILARHAAWSRDGLRTLAIAVADLGARPSYGRDDERDLTLLGFVTFLDRPKEGAREAIQALSELGVAVKVITGDAELVARHVAGLVGLSERKVLTGAQLDDPG